MKESNSHYYQNGWTLVELMVTVALIGVLAAIAVPAYNGYITTSQNGAARANADQLALFEEAYFYENDSTYLAGTYNPTTDDPATNVLTTGLGWVPSGDNNAFTYEVTTASGGACPNGTGECYTVTVTMIGDPSIVQSITRP